MFSLRSHADYAVFLAVLVLSCFQTWRYATAARVPQDEVEAFKQITTKMGVPSWKFNADYCPVEMVGIAPDLTDLAKERKTNITCDCSFEKNTICHIVAMVIKRYSLPGVLPPELVKLPHLQYIDFAYNYLNGPIPVEWASMQLNFISVLANRLSGKIPKELGKLTSLTYLSIEANQFFGSVPAELGKLINLKTLVLSSNRLSGNLPAQLAGLNLTDFRINDNYFNGTIPDFIKNWKHLDRLEMHASGLTGPIPSSISSLEKLTKLRISDINGSSQQFPGLRNMTGLTTLVLRNCNISGGIPPYIWEMKSLITLDLSFNKLVGAIPEVIRTESVQFFFLSGNLLSGNIPKSILRKGTTVDLSYNHFTWQSPEQPACRQDLDLNINLFQSSSMENNSLAFFIC